MADAILQEQQRELDEKLARLREALRGAPPRVQVELEQQISDIEGQRERLAVEIRNRNSMDGGSEA